MTKAEKAFLMKMSNTKLISFKTKELGWIHIDGQKPFTDERIEKLNRAGIGVVPKIQDAAIKHPMDALFFYVIADYEFHDRRFTATKKEVHSVPIAVEDESVPAPCVFADMIDLTDFAGVIELLKFRADTVVIGDDVRMHDDDVHRSYAATLCGDRDYSYMFMSNDIRHVKVVGGTPILDNMK